MEPIFTLCHADEWTPEKVIFYVKDLKDVAQSDYITTDMKHGTEYAVHGVTKLEGPYSPVDMYCATHKVTAVRVNPPKHFGDVPPAGSIFYRISRAVGEYTTQDDMRVLTGALTVQTIREIMSGLENSAPYHYLVSCTPAQRMILFESMRIDAERCGLMVMPEDAKEPHEAFEFVQWGTRAKLYFEDADYFLVRATRIRERSVIGRDNKETEDGYVTEIKGDKVYVRMLTNNPTKDQHQGATYEWEGKFIVLNY